MAQTKRACIVGGGTSKFGVRAATIFDMLQEAANAMSKDIPGLKPKDIDGLILGVPDHWHTHMALMAFQAEGSYCFAC